MYIYTNAYFFFFFSNIFCYSISNIEDMERAEYYFKERILNSFGSYEGLNNDARRYIGTFYTSKSIQVDNFLYILSF